jgi:hypothetical protein
VLEGHRQEYLSRSIIHVPLGLIWGHDLWLGLGMCQTLGTISSTLPGCWRDGNLFIYFLI